MRRVVFNYNLSIDRRAKGLSNSSYLLAACVAFFTFLPSIRVYHGELESLPLVIGGALLVMYFAIFAKWICRAQAVANIHDRILLRRSLDRSIWIAGAGAAATIATTILLSLVFMALFALDVFDTLATLSMACGLQWSSTWTIYGLKQLIYVNAPSAQGGEFRRKHERAIVMLCIGVAAFLGLALVFALGSVLEAVYVSGG